MRLPILWRANNIKTPPVQPTVTFTCLEHSLLRITRYGAPTLRVSTIHKPGSWLCSLELTHRLATMRVESEYVPTPTQAVDEVVAKLKEMGFEV